MVRARQVRDDNKVHALRILDNLNTLRICNTYRFSMATPVMRMRCSVMLYVYCQSCVPPTACSPKAMSHISDVTTASFPKFKA